jgi:hypothetical protein
VPCIQCDYTGRIPRPPLTPDQVAALPVEHWSRLVYGYTEEVGDDGCATKVARVWLAEEERNETR